MCQIPLIFPLFVFTHTCKYRVLYQNQVFVDAELLAFLSSVMMPLWQVKGKEGCLLAVAEVGRYSFISLLLKVWNYELDWCQICVRKSHLRELEICLKTESTTPLAEWCSQNCKYFYSSSIDVMSSSGGHSLPFVGKSGFLVDNVFSPLKHDVLFMLAFAVPVRCITVPSEDKTSGETNPKSSDFFFFLIYWCYFTSSLCPLMMIMPLSWW